MNRNFTSREVAGSTPDEVIEYNFNIPDPFNRTRVPKHISEYAFGG
jgi:hypothetical protein